MKSRTLAFLYLGIALYRFGEISFLQWQYYAIIVPFILLLVISEDEEEQ